MIPESPDPPLPVLVDVPVLVGVLENAPVENAPVPGFSTGGALHGRTSSELAGDTDVEEEIEVDFPGQCPSIAGIGLPSASHSDTDAPDCVSSLEEFRVFASTLSHLVPQPPPEEQWLQPKRRKKYTKRYFGPPNVRTRSSTSVLSVSYD